MGWTFYNSSGQRLSSAATNISVLDIDGATDIGADIITGDLLIIDDGASGANRKTTVDRLAAYVDVGLHPELGSNAVVQVWCQIASGGALEEPDIGVATVGDTAVGLADINFTTPFTSTIQAFGVAVCSDDPDTVVMMTGPATADTQEITQTTGGTDKDQAITVLICGLQ
tara:strand:- start:151 stop:660 length:510 start_codon:yes stop_codon:yes gene_type:complete